MSKRPHVENQNKGRFARVVLPIISVQRFYSNSSHKPRDTWLEKYTYRTVDEHESSERCPPENSLSPLSTENKAFDLQHDGNSKIDRKRVTDKVQEKLPFAFDPYGVVYFVWLAAVSLGVLYNCWALILRIAFPAIQKHNLLYFLCLDYFFDVIFVLDIIIQCLTGFLSEGQLVLISSKLWRHYSRSTGFVLDCLSVLPLDFLYFLFGFEPLFRLNKLLKCRRFFLFCERGEIYSGRPKLFNLIKLLHYLFLIIHWVACLYYIVSRYEGLGTGKWVHPKAEGEWAEVKLRYVYCFFRSTVSLTTVGSGVTPFTLTSLVFVIVTYLCGVLIFATIVGNASDMIVDFRRSREQYLKRVDGMKAYFAAHKLPDYLQQRVVQWFEYLWTYKKDIQDEELFHQMNDSIKADIAIHVHLATLKKVRMFEECDPGFLRELILKLKPHLCSPGDYVCRQDDVGHDMYIVNKGRLEVLDQYGNNLRTLSAGTHFGEISILNIKGIGNRRTASVRSIGFSDLFRLSKNDLEEVLQYYPEAKTQLEKIAKETYETQRKHRIEVASKAQDSDDFSTEQDQSLPSFFHSDDDPRKWFFADEKSLRRQLSDIEARLEVRKLANKFRRENKEKDAKVIVAEFAKGALQDNTNNSEARTFIEDFLKKKRQSRKAKLPQRTKSVKLKISSPSFSRLKRQDSLPERNRKASFQPVTVLNEESGAYEVSDIMRFVDPDMETAQHSILLPKVAGFDKGSNENSVVYNNDNRIEYGRSRTETVATANVFNILKKISSSKEPRKFRRSSSLNSDCRYKTIAGKYAVTDFGGAPNWKREDSLMSKCGQSTCETAASPNLTAVARTSENRKCDSLKNKNKGTSNRVRFEAMLDSAHDPIRRTRSSGANQDTFPLIIPHWSRSPSMRGQRLKQELRVSGSSKGDATSGCLPMDDSLKRVMNSNKESDTTGSDEPLDSRQIAAPASYSLGSHG